MDKRLWINIGLLGLVILLCVLALNSEEETKQDLPRLSNIDQNDIVQIQVLRKDLEDFKFNKQNETWYMTAPQQFRANNSRINAMLRLLKTESFGQLDPAEVNLEQLGLSDPVVAIKFNGHEFKFGITDAIDQRRYVLFDGKVHLTNDSLYQQLMTNAAFFADTRLLPESFKITAIQFPENKLEKVNDGWQLETLMDISPDQLKRIAFSWANATAISADKYEPTETTEAKSIIKISSANNESIQFVIVATEPHLILGRKDIGLQYHMGSDVAGQLLLEQNEAAKNDDPVMLIN